MVNVGNINITALFIPPKSNKPGSIRKVITNDFNWNIHYFQFT